MEDIDRIIETEDLTAMVNAIESKVNGSDYTAMDIAAAFLKMCTGMTMGDDGSAEDMDFGDTGAEEPGMVRLFINIGKKQKANREIFLERLRARPECLENSWYHRYV